MDMEATPKTPNNPTNPVSPITPLPTRLISTTTPPPHPIALPPPYISRTESLSALYDITPLEASPQIDLETETPPNFPIDDYFSEVLASQCTPLLDATVQPMHMSDLTLPSNISHTVPSSTPRRVIRRPSSHLPARPIRPTKSKPRPSPKRRNVPPPTITLPSHSRPPTDAIHTLTEMAGPVSSQQLIDKFNDAINRAKAVATEQKLEFREQLKKNPSNPRGTPAEISSRREARVSRRFKSCYQVAIEHELYAALHENLLAWNVIKPKPKVEAEFEHIMAEVFPNTEAGVKRQRIE